MNVLLTMRVMVLTNISNNNNNSSSITKDFPLEALLVKHHHREGDHQ
jgi:hypothetical protein